MNSSASEIRRLPSPEGLKKHYDDAVKEEEIALKGGSIPGKILHVAFGWDPMPAVRYNEAMRGVGRAHRAAQNYRDEYLDLLIPEAERYGIELENSKKRSA